MEDDINLDRRTLTMDRDELVEMVEDLAQVLDRDETEILKFKEILELLVKIRKITQKQQDMMKRDIAALCSLVEEDKGKLSQNEAAAQYIQKETDIEHQRSRTEQDRALLEEQCLQVSRDKAELEKLQDKLAAERETIENNTTKVLPKIRYDLNLYNMICRIRWQYDSSVDHISGYVCNKGDVKPFSLSRKQNSQFFITNYLWDLIEEGGPGW